MASSARAWLSGVTPAQQDASTRIGTSGKNAFSSMALDMTQISVHSPTRVILSIGSTSLFRSFNQSAVRSEAAESLL